MTGARAELGIDKPADEVWGLIGDVGNLGWIPNVQSVQRDGDVRTVQFGDTIVTHRLLKHDDAARSYTYTLASDVTPRAGDVTPRAGKAGPVTEATLSIVPDGSSASTMIWTSETEERKGSSEGLSAFFRGVLDHVKCQLEHA